MPYRKPSPWGQTKPPVGYQLNSTGVTPLSCWLFNEGGGAKARDIGATRCNSGNTGLENGLIGGASAPTWGAGLFGRALTFVGGASIGYITAGAVSPLLNNFSVAGWLCRTANPSTYSVWYSNGMDGGSKGWACYFSTGINHFFLKSGVAGIDSGIASPLNKWEHVTWTVQSDNKARLYINGVLKFTSSNTTALNAGSTGDAFIGADQSTVADVLVPGVYYGGKIDHVMFFGSALSDSQVMDLYANPFSKIVTPRRRIISGAASATTGATNARMPGGMGWGGFTLAGLPSGLSAVG